MQERYLTTAAFAALAGVNKKTLHYYDEIGLFCPAYTNQKGYRFYSPLQLDQLALIVTLKDLSVPLKVIRSYLDGGDLARLDEILTRQSEQLARRLAQLQQRQAQLQEALQANRAFLAWCGKGPQRQYRPPERLAVLLGPQEMENSRVVIVNYLTDGPGTGLCAEGGRRFLYQKQPEGPLLAAGGDYLCLYEATAQPPWPWLQQRRAQLQQYAAAHGFALEDRAYVEFSELAPAGKPGARVLRMRIAEG